MIHFGICSFGFIQTYLNLLASSKSSVWNSNLYVSIIDNKLTKMITQPRPALLIVIG